MNSRATGSASTHRIVDDYHRMMFDRVCVPAIPWVIPEPVTVEVDNVVGNVCNFGPVDSVTEPERTNNGSLIPKFVSGGKFKPSFLKKKSTWRPAHRKLSPK